MSKKLFARFKEERCFDEKNSFNLQVVSSQYVTLLYDNLYLNNCCRYENQTFLLKANVLKFTQQKFERKNQRNKRFIKLFTNAHYASPCLHGTHRNGIPFLAKLNFACHFCMVRRSGGCFKNSVRNLR